jgi:asparagine synthase (glutamine-hydrolysing)
MVSSSGRFVIAFNGEIYNFRTLRKELEASGHIFTGHSDTEVMLAGFEAWGVQAALERFSGMFALALVDRSARRLCLARDRMGEKPLYYGWQGSTLLFGSELKPLREHPSWQGEVDASVLPLLLRHNLIPAPYSIYKNIRKLPPSTFLSFDLETIQSGNSPVPVRYWRIEDFIRQDTSLDLSSASRRLESLLDEVISEQMISDVPLGAFLSGGIDSSAVVALMQKQASRPVSTFSIGFQEEGFNEAEHAAAVASLLGTDHTEMYVTSADALNVIPHLPTMYDEPFADSSQIPTYLVSRMTRQHVTVALSGDGGDELFCGYPRYPSTVAGWCARRGPKARLRALIAQLPPDLAVPVIRMLSGSQRGRSDFAIRRRLADEAGIASAGTLSEYYRQRVSYWQRPEEALVRRGNLDYALTLQTPNAVTDDPLKTLMLRDINWYLPDDILTKVDRAAMACSLETRIPLLDRRIVEFAMGLPTTLNMHNGVGKQVLRDLLFRHVPRRLIERPKQGFAVPLANWLRGPLRDWAESLLDPTRLREQGYWNEKGVRAVWDEHLRGREDYSFELWGILMFQAWLGNQGGR